MPTASGGWSSLDAAAVEPPEHFHLLERALDGADGVVGVHDRGAPERHDPVAHELVERALRT